MASPHAGGHGTGRQTGRTGAELDGVFMGGVLYLTGEDRVHSNKWTVVTSAALWRRGGRGEKGVRKGGGKEEERGGEEVERGKGKERGKGRENGEERVRNELQLTM